MGEVVKGAVKEELTKLCVSSYEALSLPHDIVTLRNIQNDWLTPDHRWLQFADHSNEQRSLLNC